MPDIADCTSQLRNRITIAKTIVEVCTFEFLYNITDECNELAKKIEFISPGLIKKKDENNTIVELPLKEALIRRFHYENRKLRQGTLATGWCSNFGAYT